MDLLLRISKKLLIDSMTTFPKLEKTLSEKVEISDLDTNFLKPTDYKFEFKNVTVEEVLSELKNLKENKSSGWTTFRQNFLNIPVILYSSNINDHI